MGIIQKLFTVLLLSQPILAAADKGAREYSPYLDQEYRQKLFFGDTHVHTPYSTDAGMAGNRLGPDEVYRFARGEEVTSSSGLRAKLQNPLDFLVVTGHAENLGLAPMIAECVTSAHMAPNDLIH